MTSYQYRKSHCGDKTILRPSYLHNGISYTGKLASLYWIGALASAMGGVTHQSWDNMSGVSYHQPNHCLLNHLFRHRSKKTSKLCDTGLCTRNSLVTGEFPTQKSSNAENVSIWWRHHVWWIYHINFIVIMSFSWSSHPQVSDPSQSYIYIYIGK